MKKKLYTSFFVWLVILGALFFLTGCASTDKSRDPAKDVVPPPLFEDWQYRGFGSEYPAWCEVVLLNDDHWNEEIEPFFPEIQGNLDNLYCMRIAADSVDICSATLTNEELIKMADRVIARTWVKINPYYEEFDREYFSFILCIQDSQEDSQ